MSKQKLTVKQKAFADYYIELGNATQAAIKAGYSEKYANTNASKLLRNTAIAEYIAQRLAELESERIADADEVLQYLTAVMRGKHQEQTLIGRGMGEQAITKIDVSASQRIDAAKQLGKRYGLWTDKFDIGGAVQVVFSGEDELED